MNLYKEKILQHNLKGQRRAHHKYLYIDENGRYVYPEDVKSDGSKKTISGYGYNEERKKDYNLKQRIAGFKTEEEIRSRTEKMKRKGDYIRKDNKDLKEDLKDGSLNTWVNPEAITVSPKRITAQNRNKKRVEQTRSAHQEAVWQNGSVGSTINWSDGSKSDTRTVNPTHMSKGLKKYSNISTGSSRKIEANKKYADKERKRNRHGTLIWEENPNDPGHEKGYDADTINLAKAEYNTDKRKAEAKRKKKVDDQRQSAHAGYESDKKKFHEGGSTEELERQKEKTKARKSAKNVVKDTNVVRISSENRENERDRHNQHKQINSAHKESTRFRPEGGHLYNGDWVLESRTHNNASESLERQKRKTALRKRHKK